MRYKLISCEVFYREMCHAVSQSPHIVDVEFLPKGLHDMGANLMRSRIQDVVDDHEGTHYDAILLGYGLCNNGLAGIQAGSAPLVLPRAHDCITLFLGGKERYETYFYDNPGVYFKTSGWMERGDDLGELSQLSIQRATGMDSDYASLVAKYGEENAAFLYETLCNQTRYYTGFTFIEMGIEPSDAYERQARADAESRGWTFRRERGDMRLIYHLVNGDWSEEEFLVIPPGRRIIPTFNESIIAFEPRPDVSSGDTNPDASLPSDDDLDNRKGAYP